MHNDLTTLRKDVETIKSTMVTKDHLAHELKRFATKDDLKNFATKDDLKNFATKKDLKGFATKEDVQLIIEHMDSFFVRGNRLQSIEGKVSNHEARI